MFSAESFLSLSLSFSGKNLKIRVDTSRYRSRCRTKLFFHGINELVFALPLFFSNASPPSATYSLFSRGVIRWPGKGRIGGRSRCLTLSVYQVVFALLPLYFPLQCSASLCFLLLSRSSSEHLLYHFIQGSVTKVFVTIFLQDEEK